MTRVGRYLVLFALCWTGVAFGQSDLGLCSQVYMMHQYCTSQGGESGRELSPPNTAVHEGRVGKSGAPGRRGPPGTVNYTAIWNNIDKKFEAKEHDIDERHADFERKMNKTMEAVFSEKEIQPTSFPTDCQTVSRREAKIRQSLGGVFDIYPESRNNRVEVYCDLETDGGGWTVFQRRMDGSEDFYREWEEYAEGFGEKHKEMWLGLETIYQLTKSGRYELRVDLTDWEGNMAYAKYSQFSISNRADNYRLTVGGYSGDAGDSLRVHNGRAFSAFNVDLDSSSGSCAKSLKSGWWYNACHYANPNGLYYNGPVSESKGIIWYHWKNTYISLKSVEMKFRKSG